MSTTIKGVTSSRELSLTGMFSSESVMVTARNGEGVSVQVYRADLLAALRTEGILPAEVEPVAEPDPLTGAEQMEFLAQTYGQKVVPDDAIVILRETLPEVVVTHDVKGRPLITAGGATLDEQGWAHGSDALGWIAINAYRDANPPAPPIDEAMVAKIRAVLKAEDDAKARHTGTTITQYDEVARSLYRAGVRIEATK